MKIDESQKKQLIVLCCLIAFVVGFGVYRLVGGRTGAAATATVSSDPLKQAKDVPTSQAPSKAEVTVAETATVDVPQPKALEAGRDPFAPQILPKLPKDKTVVSRNIGSQQEPPLIKVGPMPVFTRVNRKLTVERSSDNGSVASAAPDLDAIKDLKLTGIIVGSMKLAIIHGAGNTRYIVREGQLVDGKYKVVHISSHSVWIKFENRNFVMRLGGNDSSGTRA